MQWRHSKKSKFWMIMIALGGKTHNVEQQNIEFEPIYPFIKSRLYLNKNNMTGHYGRKLL